MKTESKILGDYLDRGGEVVSGSPMEALNYARQKGSDVLSMFSERLKGLSEVASVIREKATHMQDREDAIRLMTELKESIRAVKDLYLSMLGDVTSMAANQVSDFAMNNLYPRELLERRRGEVEAVQSKLGSLVQNVESSLEEVARKNGFDPESLLEKMNSIRSFVTGFDMGIGTLSSMSTYLSDSVSAIESRINNFAPVKGVPTHEEMDDIEKRIIELEGSRESDAMQRIMFS